MELSSGSPEVVVGLIDGAVTTNHPDLAAASIRQLEPPQDGTRAGANHAARDHGTYVAGILSARRGSAAPAICPGCTLLVRRIFLETPSASVEMPSATPDELADAIVECVDAGARVLNLSVAVAQPSPNRERRLEDSLNYAAQRAALVVAAAGNQGTVGGSAITRHPWVIPVAACDAQGRPLGMTNLGSAIGRRGLMAPGDAITSLDSDGGTTTSSGTSAATPFVTGTIALIWSIFRRSSAATIKTAVTRAVARRNAVVPPVVDAAAAYQFMTAHAMR
jgi:subtilisin family serine protease